MMIKASAASRKDSASISEEQMLNLRAKVLQAEQERINGAQTLSVAEAREKLGKRFKGI